MNAETLDALLRTVTVLGGSGAAVWLCVRLVMHLLQTGFERFDREIERARTDVALRDARILHLESEVAELRAQLAELRGNDEGRW